MKRLTVVLFVLLSAMMAVAQSADVLIVDKTKQFPFAGYKWNGSNVHGFASDGTLVKFTIICKVGVYDCAPLQVGDKFNVRVLEASDPDRYKINGMSIRITGSDSSMVYLVVESVKDANPIVSSN